MAKDKKMWGPAKLAGQKTEHFGRELSGAEISALYNEGKGIVDYEAEIKKAEIKTGKGLYEQIKGHWEKSSKQVVEQKLAEEKNDIPYEEVKPLQSYKVEVMDMSAFDSPYPSTSENKPSRRGSWSDYTQILVKELDELKANQKPKEWSDDIVLIDINKLTAWMLSKETGKRELEWYTKHKENLLSDDEFDAWDQTYESILKFRRNEQ